MRDEPRDGHGLPDILLCRGPWDGWALQMTVAAHCLAGISLMGRDNGATTSRHLTSGQAVGFNSPGLVATKYQPQFVQVKMGSMVDVTSAIGACWYHRAHCDQMVSSSLRATPMRFS